MDDWINDSEEEQADGGKFTRLTAFYIGAPLLPVIVICDLLGRFDLGLNLFLCLFVNAAVIRSRWELKKYIWFWVVMVIVVALELPIAFTVKWPAHQWVPAVALLPVVFAGYLFAMGVIKLVEHFMGEAPPPDEEA